MVDRISLWRNQLTMHYPPVDICRRLARFHPQLRLGWDGENQTFGLIQLYHRRDAKLTYREFWDNRGPTFSKTGRPIRDWDFWARKPVYLIDISPGDVCGGEVIGLVKRWARPIASRFHESLVESKKDNLRAIDAMGYDAGNRIFKEGQRDGSGAPILAKKFHEPTVNMVKYRNFDEGEYIESKLPAAPPGGWQKHIDKDQGDAGVLGDVGCD